MIEWKRHIVICDCRSPEHQIVFEFDPNEPDKDFQFLYIQTHLSETVLDRKNVINLRNFLDTYLMTTTPLPEDWTPEELAYVKSSLTGKS